MSGGDVTTTRALQGQTAVVTGASSGIGRAIAEHLGELGADVVLSGRVRDAMEASAKVIEGFGGRCTIVTGDVCDSSVVRSLVDAALAIDGHLDVFVNNAGVSYIGPVLGGREEQWRLMFDTNVLALLVGCQAAIRAMREGGRPGHVVNISSVAAQSPASGVYGATKHAVNVITNSLRDELLDDPIKITSVMPGLVATNLARTMDPALIEGFVAMSGVNATFVPGERLPDDVIVAAQAALSDIMIRAEDIAAAVGFVLTQPASVQISEIVVRPNKDFDLG
jgi:NADP-dependent 3-hydroxy acid dehydrogenase YdfG